MSQNCCIFYFAPCNKMMRRNEERSSEDSSIGASQNAYTQISTVFRLMLRIESLDIKIVYVFSIDSDASNILFLVYYFKIYSFVSLI